MLSKKYEVLDQKLCVACGVCTKVCPKGAIEVWKGSYAVVNAEACIGCGICARTCPAGVIDVISRGVQS